MNFWSENIDIVWQLAEAYKSGGLTLFTGAGVSRGCGLPLWPELVRTLHTEAARRTFPKDGMYGTFDAPKGWGGLAVAHSELEYGFLEGLALPIQSRFCKSQLGEDYKSALQSALYAAKHKVSRTVGALAKLEGLRAICTYNYDDLLEATAPKTFTPAGEPSDKIGPETIPVYHVHGLIPSDLTSAPSDDIVFSEDEYHAVYLNFGHWSNLIQLSLLLGSKSALFVGISFEDPNLRRLLDAARRARPDLRLFNLCRLPFERPLDRNDPMSPATIQANVLEAVYRDIGVTNLWLDNYEPDIPFVLESIARDDPVMHYTSSWRDRVRRELESQALDGMCGHIECEDQAVRGYRYCVAHLLGDRTRFMDIAPMPKTMADQCSSSGCLRITSGLSDLCVAHLQEKTARDAKLAGK